MKHKTIIEPFKIKSVEPVYVTTEEQRIEYLKTAKNNPFLLKSDQVIIDFLTDSGTSAMSAEQWAGIMRGDESYAGSKSWERMEDAIKHLTGMEFILPTHQGRAAERIIYGHLGGPGKTFISNTHFDTTRANIEFSGAEAIDIAIDESNDPALIHPFKGNINTDRLEKLINEKGAKNVGAVILTVTNNSGGGQPVSMQNTREVSAICKKYGVLLLLDCCRVAENAYFIKLREAEYKDKPIRHIVKEMFKNADGMTMSSKKDAIVNMGGFIAMNDKGLFEKASMFIIVSTFNRRIILHSRFDP